MTKLPRITPDELLGALKRDGWEVVPARGGHLHLRHPSKPGRVDVPYLPDRIVKLGTLRSILNQAGLTADDLRDLL